MKKIKIISLVVVFIFLLVTSLYLISNRAIVTSNNDVLSKEATANSFKPQVVKLTYRAISRKEFLQYLAKSKGTNITNAINIDTMLTRSFKEKHPEFFGKKASQKSTGHYEYSYIARTIDMGPMYYEKSGKRKKEEVRIKEFVYTKVYVNGSSRSFVYVSDPFTDQQGGNYSWHQASSHTFLENDHPAQFVAMATGYAEVAVNNVHQISLGAPLGVIWFRFRRSVSVPYYYTKDCFLPTWRYVLHPWA